ncbi:MAG: DNA repair protein RecO, partial [bacterium]|nr:DNA repair protein RecO [bacterium]MDW8164445.1 DNA repair protein RecO [Candidatus Omnitrophota bacterium]
LLKFFYFQDNDSFKVYFHILKLIDVFTPDLEKEESIFYLIKEIAETLETNKKQYLLFLAFKLRFIEILGYGIKLDKCCICEKEMERYFFSPKKGGVICKNCNKEDPNCVKISKKIISIMRFIKKIEIKNVEVLNIKKIDAEKINYLCNLTLYYHTNLNFIWWKNENNIFR